MYISYVYPFGLFYISKNDTEDRVVASLDAMDFVVVVDEGDYYFRIAMVDCPMV